MESLSKRAEGDEDTIKPFSCRHIIVVAAVFLLVLGQLGLQRPQLLELSAPAPSSCLPSSSLSSPSTSSTSLQESRDWIICYGSQGPAKSFAGLQSRFERSLPNGTYAFFYHSFDEVCDGCVFQKGTTFSEGKNIATKAAMTSPIWRRCKYWTFFDDDIELRRKKKEGNNMETTASGITSIEEDSWRDYHNMLLDPDTIHPIIKAQDSARDQGDTTTMYQTSVDEHFVSFRFDYVSLLWPLTTRYKDYFWLNNDMFFVKMTKCYPAGIRVDHRYVTTNPKHRYEADNNPVYNYDTKRCEEVLQDELPGLSPWTCGLGQHHRSNVQPLPPLDRHPKCAEEMNRRLDLWLTDKLPEDHDPA